MQALGFDRLISVLIPGFVLAASVWMALDRFLSEGALKDGLKRLPEGEWQFAFVALIAAAFFGGVLRSFIGWVEARLLDRRQARRIGISDDEYEVEWDKYVDHLDAAKNPYVGELALTFFFESRTSASLFALAASLLVWAHESYRCAATLATLAVALFLGYQADQSHLALAEYRHRRFGSSTGRIKIESAPAKVPETEAK